MKIAIAEKPRLSWLFRDSHNWTSVHLARTTGWSSARSRINSAKTHVAKMLRLRCAQILGTPLWTCCTRLKVNNLNFRYF